MRGMYYTPASGWLGNDVTIRAYAIITNALMSMRILSSIVGENYDVNKSHNDNDSKVSILLISCHPWRISEIIMNEIVCRFFEIYIKNTLK